MDHISRLLPRVLQKRGIAQHATAALVVYRAKLWLREHLPHLESSLRVTTLRDGVLMIECVHPIAAQECQGASKALLTYLQEESGTVVTEIRTVRSRAG